jgi:hypothetical protein
MSHGRKVVYLGEKLASDVELMLAATDRKFTELVRELVREEVARWQRSEKEPATVGRPRQTADEKQFKDRVQYIDGMYQRLRDLHKDQFDSLFDDQYALYRTAVEERRFDVIAWWYQTVPWQRPKEFSELWRNRASNCPPEIV